MNASKVQRLRRYFWWLGGREMLLRETTALRSELHNLRFELVDMLADQGVRAPLPKIKSKEETLNELLTSNKSLARFGDGEIRIALGRGIEYQEHSLELERRLRQILVNSDDQVLVGLPKLFGSLEMLKAKHKAFWREFWAANREATYELIAFDKVYYDTQISRPYIIYNHQDNLDTYFEGIKKIWNGANVVIVEGERSKVGVGNDLFSSVLSLGRIIGPARHAFRRYSELFDEAKKQPKNTLFVLALGPTATVMARDLALEGYRALDMGHIDLEYEWFLRKCTTKTIIAGKCLAEGGFRNRLDPRLEDTKFQQQVLARIT